MQSMWTAFLLLAATLGAGPAAKKPPELVMEERPLAKPDFVLLHTNDTQGYLESCG